jgi:hypothetical protein
MEAQGISRKQASITGGANIMNKESRRIVLLLAIITCILALICGCNAPIPDISESSDTTGSTEATEQATPIPTPTPTKKPTSTPTPTPASVYISREELPDGRLFEEGYYAVLPGEGAYMNVFDCYGQQIDSFQFTDGEGISPEGLRTEKDLSVYYRFNQKDVQTITPVNEYEYGNFLHSNKNGFYQINYDERQVILYNTEGKHIRTLNCPEGTQDSYVDIVVACYGEETVVSFKASEQWIYLTAIYFVALDGKINDTCIARDPLHGVDGLLGRKYFLDEHGSWDQSSCDVYDFDGNKVMQNVSVMESNSLILCSNEQMTLIFVSDYYMKDGKTYNASFQPVKKNTVEAYGDLIYGVEYDVEGIQCVTEYWKGCHIFYESFSPQELIAVGESGDQMAIKTQDDEYVITCNEFEYYDMNEHVLVLSDSNGTYQVISLETDEVLNTIMKAQEILVADEYLLVYSGEVDENWMKIGSYIIDKDGNVRYYAQNAYMESTAGEYIILKRGPYIGIADLNGEWIIKTLSWELTRDAEYKRPMYQ